MSSLPGPTREEPLRDFLDNATIPIHWVGPDGTILRANRAELALLGYSADEYIGRRIADFHVDRTVIDDILRRLEAGETLRDYPARLRCKDGSIRYVVIDSSVYRDGDRFVHSRCFTRDVTHTRLADDERLRALTAEQAARARAETAERRLAVLADIARSLTEALDLDIVLQRVVDGARELSACDSAAIFLREGDTDQMVPRTRVGADLTIYRTLRITPGRGIGGEVMQTGRPVRTENYLADPRVPEGFRAIVAETGTVALMVVPITIRGRVEGLLYISNNVARLFADEDEAVCMRLADHAAIAIHNARLFRSERDARSEAEAANRAKDEFLAVLSHELRTPLTSILGWARLLRGAHLDERREAQGLESIERNARLQAQLIEDLLDVSRIVTGKLELDRRPLDLAAVVAAALDEARPSIRAKELTLRAELADAPAPILGDPARLQQVVWNLVVNATKFTPSGGTITVTLAAEDAELRLTVADTGAGIPADALPHIFDRFRQADTGSRRQHGGLGLGLAITRQLVELHGGTVTAENIDGDGGARFVVRLPMRPETTRMPRSPALTVGADASATTLAGLQVVVVDDDADTRDLLGVVLARAGADIVVAETVAEALDAVVRTRPSLVLADIGMPGENGYDLVRHLRALRNGLERIPAVALTAYASVQDRERALAAGFSLHLAKPVEPAELIETVAKLGRAGQAPPAS